MAIFIMVELLALLPCIREILGSIIGLDLTDFFWVSSAIPSKCWDSALN
jgi:hypothetical protein